MPANRKGSAHKASPLQKRRRIASPAGKGNGNQKSIAAFLTSGSDREQLLSARGELIDVTDVASSHKGVNLPTKLRNPNRPAHINAIDLVTPSQSTEKLIDAQHGASALPVERIHGAHQGQAGELEKGPGAPITAAAPDGHKSAVGPKSPELVERIVNKRDPLFPTEVETQKPSHSPQRQQNTPMKLHPFFWKPSERAARGSALESSERAAPRSPGPSPAQRLPAFVTSQDDRMPIKSSALDLPLHKYDPVHSACWHQGQPAPYLHMATAFGLLSSTTKRLTKADVLVNMFRSLMALSPDDVLPAVYLSSNKLSSSFEGINITVGEATVSAAVCDATGAGLDRMRTLYTELGDLGDVAQAMKVKQRMLAIPQPLTIRAVYQTIIDMAGIRGQGCEARKRGMMVKLMRACRGTETRYLVRTLVQHIRTGATLISVLGSLAQAAVVHHLPPPSAEGPSISRASLDAKMKASQSAIKECYNSCPDIPLLVKSLVEGGIEAMQQACTVRVGTPIKPMLAKICSGIPEVLEKYSNEPFTCEYKYDGQRAQIHVLADGTIKVFNRHIENMTDKYPDIARLLQEVQRELGPERLQDAILDAELVAVDRAQNNKLLAFQALSTRGRKEVTAEQVTIHVCLYAFDLLFLNGESLVKFGLRERRQKLYDLFPARPGYFLFAHHIETADSQAIYDFLQEALDASCEGIMTKSLQHEYEPSKRTDSWLKIKKDYVEGLQDSLDLVPIGAWYGNGRKVGWFSPFLVACYDPRSEEFQSVCRVMSGFTDEFYKDITAFYKDGRILEGPKPYYRTTETPSVWFEPCKVWELRGAELTISPVHKAATGLIDPQKGLSLRFPRFIRSRDDKGPEDATPGEMVAQLFRLQVRRLEAGDEKEIEGAAEAEEEADV